ncbi:unnamed protein product [Lepeophtheirus salmonis]|uniref:(salmon louse) hypothetical protein n=1 Tax=Lepeophtheirus salmonis TaxID=72036 RepID=A0A7R8CIB7_LEPSM|nr:unnamed protein product [Lepeophtheirus salmonis]CAF2794236.1 unnamed protein product [Lepeophtheirus salmonis]
MSKLPNNNVARGLRVGYPYFRAIIFDFVTHSQAILWNRLSELESSEDSIGLLTRFTNWIQQLKRKIMMKEEDIQGAVPLSSKSRIRLQNLTGLSDDEIKSRRKEFYQQFPEGFVTVREFQRISAKVLSRDEIGKFTENVFHLFDSDKDNRLSFEEFTIATSVSESAGPLEKLQWLFDNVYDKAS